VAPHVEVSRGRAAFVGEVTARGRERAAPREDRRDALVVVAALRRERGVTPARAREEHDDETRARTQPTPPPKRLWAQPACGVDLGQAARRPGAAGMGAARLDPAQ